MPRAGRRRALLHLSLERLADGGVDIRSIPGRGTLVAFRLPLAEAVRLEEERAAAI
jgi:hypothetical protein